MSVTREQIVETLKGMSLLEVSELVKELETTFGVSAAAPVAVAAASALYHQQSNLYGRGGRRSLKLSNRWR